jgi:hypothetical protein
MNDTLDTVTRELELAKEDTIALKSSLREQRIEIATLYQRITQLELINKSLEIERSLFLAAVMKLCKRLGFLCGTLSTPSGDRVIQLELPYGNTVYIPVTGLMAETYLPEKFLGVTAPDSQTDIKNAFRRYLKVIDTKAQG